MKNLQRIWGKVKEHALRQEKGIDGILVTVGLCIIALLLCVVMKDSLTTFIQTIVTAMQTKAADILKMTERGKQPGNIGELMTMCMCVLALTVVMLNYLQNVQLLQAKENVGQLARAYLLKMETVGYLEPAEQAHLTAELETAGLTEIDYEGSTLEPAGYGERIILQIHGKLGGHYEIREKRVSTAKN